MAGPGRRERTGRDLRCDRKGTSRRIALLKKSAGIRGDYEYQKWTSFPNGGLTPQLVTIGAAYHFTGKPRYK